MHKKISILISEINLKFIIFLWQLMILSYTWHKERFTFLCRNLFKLEWSGPFHYKLLVSYFLNFQLIALACMAQQPRIICVTICIGELNIVYSHLEIFFLFCFVHASTCTSKYTEYRWLTSHISHQNPSLPILLQKEQKILAWLKIVPKEMLF